MKKKFLLITSLAWTTYFLNADWRGFRGTEGNGLSKGEIPATLSQTSKDSWKVPLPGRGLSSPIVVGDLVFVTHQAVHNSPTFMCLRMRQSMETKFGSEYFVPLAEQFVTIKHVLPLQRW